MSHFEYIAARLLVVLLLIMAYLLLNLGYAWLDVGYGLTPWIAFPWAALNIFCSGWIGLLIYREHLRRNHALGVWVMKDIA